MIGPPRWLSRDNRSDPAGRGRPPTLLSAEAGGRFAHDAAGWLMMPIALALVGAELALWSWLIVGEPLRESTFLEQGATAGPAAVGADPSGRIADPLDKITL